jgi:hypothetical protein
MDSKEIETAQKILRNKYNVIREGVNVYRCNKCEGTWAGKDIGICPDKNCRGELKFYKKIPKEKVEEITSRRVARQCPVCMKMFYPWVEVCPYCSQITIKGKIVKKDSLLAKIFEYKMLK